jgi:hypothetical protein
MPRTIEALYRVSAKTIGVRMNTAASPTRVDKIFVIQCENFALVAVGLQRRIRAIVGLFQRCYMIVKVLAWKG